MAYLSRVTANGYTYLYLKEYSVRRHYEIKSVIIYRFGRIEYALKQMYVWRENFNLFPKELKKIGLTKTDLADWIDTLETGITKTGRNFEVVR